jgi:3'(2'), 5'-bisphosphate nucleotidase
MPDAVIAALSLHMPAVLRWAGAIARRLRPYDIGLAGKHSGHAATDALTLADLGLQELIVAALRDCDPVFRQCRLDAEETTGDLARFPADAELTIGIDPIDGTRRYRDRTGSAWSVMLHLRSKSDVLYSLVHQPEDGEHGSWIEARGDRILAGPDDPSRPAAEAVRLLPRAGAGYGAGKAFGNGFDKESSTALAVPRIFTAGFQDARAEVDRRVTALGIDVDDSDAATRRTGYQRIAAGEICGALFHSPNVYDFPVMIHLFRILGGDAVWVHDGRPVDFRSLWRDERANLLRLPGIVAASTDAAVLKRLVALARDWNPSRYRAAGEALVPAGHSGTP